MRDFNDFPQKPGKTKGGELLCSYSTPKSRRSVPSTASSKNGVAIRGFAAIVLTSPSISPRRAGVIAAPRQSSVRLTPTGPGLPTPVTTGLDPMGEEANPDAGGLTSSG